MKTNYLTLFALLCSLYTYATTITVNSQASFNQALIDANAGDIIEWTSGTYSNIFMDITKSDITVQAAIIGDVTFNGASRVEIDGSNVTFSGFQYIGGDIGTNQVIRIYGSNVTFTNVNISGYTSYKYLIVEASSQYTTVSYCNFENRINTPDQNILSILVNSTQAGFHKVQYCSFKNFSGSVNGNDAGVEPIRIGVSTTKDFESKSIVEYCYFTQCNGDQELISHKATACVYRYNTFDDNPFGELVLRHGEKGIVYGNFFTNGLGGVRIREASNHIVFNNYFENLTARSIYLQNNTDANIDVTDVVIAYNTIVNCDRVRLSNGTSDLPPSNITLANNIFTDPENSGGLFRDATGNETWIGNIANGTLGITAPASGITSIDPQLSLNPEGYYELAVTSPTIDASADDSPSLLPFPLITGLPYDNEILFDLISEARPVTITSKDVGCQEYNASAEVAPYVDADNTGPIYLMPGYVPLSNNDFIALLGSDLKIYPNPLPNNQINISFNFKSTTTIEIILYDVTGKKIQSIMNETLAAGAYNLSKIIADVTAGAYLLRVNIKDTSGNLKTSKTEKFIKL